MMASCVNCGLLANFKYFPFQPFRLRAGGAFSFAVGLWPGGFLSLRFPCAPGITAPCGGSRPIGKRTRRAEREPSAGDSQNQRKENPMNTDELSTGGASPSAESKKREGRKHCLGYSNWSLLLWSWWGGKMGCGCVGRGLRRMSVYVEIVGDC